jgi:hypothetical protein
VSSKEANELRLGAMTEAELHDLMERTTAFAARLISCKHWRFGKGGLLPGGRSACDLAQAAFENILNGGKWDKDKPLWLVLEGYVRGLVGNLAISCENRLVSGIDDKQSCGEEAWSSAVEQIASGDFDPAGKLQRVEDDDLILDVVDGLEVGSPERRIVEAVLNGSSKRAEVLAETGLKAAEYEAAKKRLRRFLEDYRQQQALGHH